MFFIWDDASADINQPLVQFSVGMMPGLSGLSDVILDDGSILPSDTSGGIHLSQQTLMLIVGGFLLFTLGKNKGRR